MLNPEDGIMENINFTQLLEFIQQLTDEQKQCISESLKPSNQPDGQSKSLFDRIEENFCSNPCCPSCENTHVRKWGKQANKQRFQCKKCKKTFTSLTKTKLSGVHHITVLDQYLECMLAGMSLRKSARHCSISLDTSFHLRHRIMSLLVNNKSEHLEGIVEIDETFFRLSHKGERGLEKPRKCGGSSIYKKKGTKRTRVKQVPVLVACDRQGHVTDAVLTRVSSDNLYQHLHGRIKAETPLCADAHLAHEHVSKRLKTVLKEIVSSSKIAVLEGVFHIQHVNGYHSTLKRWINCTLCGVATKNLTKYLGWRRVLSDESLSKRVLTERIASRWAIN